MSKKRNVPAHGRKAARSRRPRKRRFLVVAGGAVTEKQYFKQLESLYDVIIDYQQKNNSPKQLAKLAVKLKREKTSEILLQIVMNESGWWSMLTIFTTTAKQRESAMTMESNSSFPILASRSGCSTM